MVLETIFISPGIISHRQGLSNEYPIILGRGLRWPQQFLTKLPLCHRGAVLLKHPSGLLRPFAQSVTHLDVQTRLSNILIHLKKESEGGPDLSLQSPPCRATHRDQTRPIWGQITKISTSESSNGLGGEKKVRPPPLRTFFN